MLVCKAHGYEGQINSAFSPLTLRNKVLPWDVCKVWAVVRFCDPCGGLEILRCALLTKYVPSQQRFSSLPGRLIWDHVIVMAQGTWADGRVSR